MVICFEGTPGSGKSYEAIRKIIDNLRLGRIVYTNIDGVDEPLKRESIKSFVGLTDYELETRLIFLPYFQIPEFWKYIKSGSIIVLDEAHKFFSNREWSSVKNQEFASWASTHRHHGFDVVLITQKLEKIDSHVRSLVEWTYRYKKLNMFGSLVQQKYKRASYVGDDTTGKPLDNKVYSYDKRIFQCYKSFVADDVKELNVMSHANVLRHPIFFLIPVVFLLFGYFGYKTYKHGGILGGKSVVNPVVASSVLPSKAVVKEFPVAAVPSNIPIRQSGPPINSFPPASLASLAPLPVASQVFASAECKKSLTVRSNGHKYETFKCGDYGKQLNDGVEVDRWDIEKTAFADTSIPGSHPGGLTPSVNGWPFPNESKDTPKKPNKPSGGASPSSKGKAATSSNKESSGSQASNSTIKQAVGSPLSVPSAVRSPASAIGGAGGGLK